MTAEELKAIRERVEKATPGLWVTVSGSVENTIGHEVARCFSTPMIDGRSLFERKQANTEFIAHARTDIPALLNEIDQRDNRINELVEKLERLEFSIGALKADIQYAKDMLAAVVEKL